MKNVKNNFFLLRFSVFLTFFCVIFVFNSSNIFAREKAVNVFAWTAYVPQEIVKQFEKETGIRVNLSEYDNNETMYTKLKSSPNAGYDIVFPSNYFLNRMRKQNMLYELDKDKLSNFKNINPILLNKPFDPKNRYSIPYLWGATGIALNSDYIDVTSVKKWSDLWEKRFHNKVLMLNDMREVFSMALLSLGYSVNDKNPEHIKEAYLKLKALMPNVKIFNSDVEQTIYIDEDAVIGMAWNGDINIARSENRKLEFIYPEEGFVWWIDCIAITKNAPHIESAYKFINFLLRPDVAAKVSQKVGYSTPNLAAKNILAKQLPPQLFLDPDDETLARGQMQIDIDDVLPMYEKYWELLKVGG